MPTFSNHEARWEAASEFPELANRTIWRNPFVCVEKLLAEGLGTGQSDAAFFGCVPQKGLLKFPVTKPIPQTSVCIQKVREIVRSSHLELLYGLLFFFATEP